MYADENSDFLPPTAYNDANGEEVDWPSLLDPKSPPCRQNPFLSSDRSSKINSYGLNELTFVDLTDPNPPPLTRLSSFHSTSTTIMQGDIGTEDDFLPRA